ncbi:MAG TPA: hypothetical protein VMV96_03750 [Acidimicrobiales bacterium]|nr:hypothetical protein [Acidimicrobiales bacterium]
MKFRRIALIALTVLASTVVSEPWAHGVSTAAPTGLPLFQFVNSGATPLPWNAVSLKSEINNTTMLGGPHATSSATEGVIAYRTNDNHLATYTQSLGVGNPPSSTTTSTSTPSPSTTTPTTSTTTPGSSSSPQWMDYTYQNNVPTPAADPVPFFDPSGNLDLLYVDVTGHLILFTPNDPVSPMWLHAHRDAAWRPFVPTDLSAVTHTIAANGLASVQMSGPNATVAFRTAKNTVEVLTLTYETAQPIPYLNGTPSTLTSLMKPTNSTPPPIATTTTTTTSTTTTTTNPVTSTTKPPTTTTTTVPTTTTTTPPAALAFASDPIVLPGIIPSFAVLSNRGALQVFTDAAGAGSTGNSWSLLNVSTLTRAPKTVGTLAMGFNSTTLYLAATTAIGNVVLFSSPVPAQVFSGNALAPPVWNILNVTTATPGAPPLGGSLFLEATSTQVSIAGQAANWGDLFVLTSAPGSPTWSSTDVSVTAGSSARTVANVVTGTQVGSTLTLFAAGVSSPPPQGVGVYAIPSNKWGQAITDGWPIISETGGLGTTSAPWVGFTNTSSVANSPDFLMGQSIYNSHKRVTWLSFWTISGPMKSEPRNATTYYSHGFAAGQWVANQIDQYRSLGVGLKPDWVILDPEGYPDNHSGLDAPAGSSNAVIAQYAGYWSQMLQGWETGINSVDPSLKAGVYASQSEYRNYNLVTQSLPVFVALAFGYGGPIPVAGASGSNIRGFITFNATCSPTASLKGQESTLLNPPWAGQFNTLQFNAGVYCPPA